MFEVKNLNKKKKKRKEKKKEEKVIFQITFLRQCLPQRFCINMFLVHSDCSLLETLFHACMEVLIKSQKHLVEGALENYAFVQNPFHIITFSLKISTKEFNIVKSTGIKNLRKMIRDQVHSFSGNEQVYFSIYLKICNFEKNILWNKNIQADKLMTFTDKRSIEYFSVSFLSVLKQ